MGGSSFNLQPTTNNLSQMLLPILISISLPVLPLPVVELPVVRLPVVRLPLVQQSVDATINRAVAAWSKIRTVKATFEQTLVNPITGSSMIARGQLQQRKPNKLAIVFSEPAGDRIVGDGRFVWLYLQSATPGQVIKLANTDVGAASTDLIGQFLTTPRSSYDVTDAGSEKVGTRSARVLILTAKAGQRLPFMRAKVWVDATDDLVRQFESTDANGITRKVRLLTLTTNVPVDTAVFTFKVPKDVRVVER